MTADVPSKTGAGGGMRLEVDIDSARGIARMRVIGAWDESEFSAGITKLTDRPDFLPGMPAIWDMGDADLGGMTEEDMRAAGEQCRRLAHRRGNAKVAMVVQDDFRFGMARMLEVLGGAPNLDIAVFRDFGAAEAWVVGEPGSTMEV